MDKQQQLDQLFAGAKQDPVMQSFEQTKDTFLASLNNPAVNKPQTKQVFTKKWIIMLTTVSTLSISLFLLWNSGETNNTPQQTQPAKTESRISSNTSIPAQQTPKPPSKQINTPKEAPFLATIQELVTELPLTLNPENDRVEIRENGYDRKTASIKTLDDPAYQFPKLTEEEIATTRKKKKAMLKALAKHDKSTYVYVPSGSFDYNGKLISVQAFYIGTGEVTNFEYRTFLFDLLIQDRKSEFLKAKPDQSAWNKELKDGGKAWEEQYFSHPAFNDFPVVNISREGAELYCKWLSEEVRKYVGTDKEAQFNDVRLPLRAEWVKAASNEGKQLPYPWDGQYRRNSRGSFQANFTHDIVKDQIDTSRWRNTIIYDNADILAPSKSFWPNALGLYNMAGNAAEMVYEGMDRSEPGTAGGSWRSYGDDIKIYAPDPYKGVTEAKPTIGFRVVSTFLTLTIKSIKTGN
ncbi:SUMF1/EgtB/PvdO family nonheme iron enzyme [Fluviicola sp.]|uniref:formylglycine-generating enzyme family protein n=1 Tax=Fluviicola sp. TaxID=1917219 RepID=UPI0031CFDB94